jgi:AraC-like DNA-binding protein
VFETEPQFASQRASQKRLHDEGRSFQHLHDFVRRDAALAALHDPSNSLSDIADMLGFADQSAFQRAFKRWTGQTPHQTRLARAGAKLPGRIR